MNIDNEHKVRVGQVYQCIDDGWKLVVTLYSPADIYFIYDNGSMGRNNKKEDFLIGKKLIAEYVTWQGAVNSKEFIVGVK